MSAPADRDRRLDRCARGASQARRRGPARRAVRGLGAERDPLRAATAKACVAGGDDISRAMITFAPNGTAKSVSVSGWAAGHGASACIQSAFKGIAVEPFARSSFVVGAVIRP